jgi:hypothetical protein
MKIFIAFSFTQLIDDTTGILKNNVREFLVEIRNELICNGHDVFLAHYREDWGEKLMGPLECTPKDFDEMRNTELVIAFPGSPISGGVHIELGWASALGKKIILMLDKNQIYSPLVEGLMTITKVETYQYEALRFENIMPNIIDLVAQKEVVKL